jgi:hypothetical protein
LRRKIITENQEKQFRALCVCVADRHQLSDLLIIINYISSLVNVWNKQTNKKSKSKLSISFRSFIPIITVIIKPSAQKEEEEKRCIYVLGYGREDLIDWIRGISSHV